MEHESDGDTNCNWCARYRNQTKCTGSYNFTKSQENVKIFAKNGRKKKNQQETLIQTIRIFCQDRRRNFGIEKCAILIIKMGKTAKTEGITKPNNQKSWGEEKLHVLGTIRSGHHQTELKEKIRQRVS